MDRVVGTCGHVRIEHLTTAVSLRRWRAIVLDKSRRLIVVVWILNDMSLLVGDEDESTVLAHHDVIRGWGWDSVLTVSIGRSLPSYVESKTWNFNSVVVSRIKPPAVRRNWTLIVIADGYCRELRTRNFWLHVKSLVSLKLVQLRMAMMLNWRDLLRALSCITFSLVSYSGSMVDQRGLLAHLQKVIPV